MDGHKSYALLYYYGIHRNISVIPKAPSEIVNIHDVQTRPNSDHYEMIAGDPATTFDVLLLVSQEGMTLQELSDFEAADHLT